jgi:formylmethanofuran dehydrogenase subunit B
LIIVLALIALGVGWYLFRPELLFVQKKVDEKFPEVTTTKAAAKTTQPELLAQGEFHSVAHDTKGNAAVYQLPDGKRVLRFSNFETSNGPAVHVYLVAADDATDNDTVKNAGFVNLGDIKGNTGDQNYDLPADLDLNKYRAVTVWCQRFSVNFGTAPLKMEMTKEASNQPVLLKEGQFHSVAHDTKGLAAVYELPDGKRVLRFTGFETSNGPAVHIYLVAADDATDSDTVKNAGFVNLGEIKGSTGDQNYDLPADLDLTKYRSVTVWCQRFGVNFGTAPLSQKS